MAYDGMVVVTLNDARGVSLRFRPVGSIISMFACGVGETDVYCCLSAAHHGALDAVDDGIVVLQSRCGDVDGRAVGHELRLYDTIVQFQFLTDATEVFQCYGLSAAVFHLQSYDAEVQPVRVHSEVLCCLNVALTVTFCSLVLNSINLVVAVPQVGCLPTVLGSQPVGVFELVPSPVGHGCQGHTCPIFKRERLQSGDVNRCGKMSVAYSERCQGVGLGHHGIVSFGHCLSVDGLSDVVGVVTHQLHLQRCPDERSDTLGVIVANLF